MPKKFVSHLFNVEMVNCSQQIAIDTDTDFVRKLDDAEK